MSNPSDRSEAAPDEGARASVPPDEGARTSVPPASGGAPLTPKATSGSRRSIPVPGASDLWAGKIRVLGELGSGAMAKVLRGYDTKLRREVALKVTKHPRKEMQRQQL